MNASPEHPQPAQRLLGYADLYATYRLTRRFVQKLVSQGDFPPAVLVGSGKLALWRADDVELWLKNRPARTTSK